jgi:hypothetical protein
MMMMIIKVSNRNLKQNVFVHFADTSKVYVYTLFSSAKGIKVYQEQVFQNLKNI